MHFLQMRFYSREKRNFLILPSGIKTNSNYQKKGGETELFEIPSLKFKINSIKIIKN